MTRRALVVDDDAMIVKLQSMILERAGFDVVTASNGQEGLDQAAATHPDVVLLDVMMPGIDGLEVTRRLKADAATKAIPVILVSARTGMEDIDAGRAAGADEYVKKPFDPDDLVDLLERLLTGA